MKNIINIQTKYGTAQLNEYAAEIVIPGIGRDYTFVQVTDLHFACYEPGDSAEAVELADARNSFWSIQAGFFAYDSEGNEIRIMPDDACEILAEHIRGMDGIDGVFFTGDTVDYPTGANFRRAEKFLNSLGKQCYIVPGNHDHVDDGEEGDTAEAFRQVMGDVPQYFVEEWDGFDILGFADGFVKVTDEQVSFLENRLNTGKPVIVLLHAPIYTEKTREAVYPMWGYNWMIGDPGRPEGKQTDANFRFRDILAQSDAVKAVITGHVHTSSQGDKQYTTAPAFAGNYRIIKIKNS